MKKKKKKRVQRLHEKVDIRTKDRIKDEKMLVGIFNKHFKKYC